MFLRAHHASAQPRRRWLATALALLVFGLGLLSVVPQLHLTDHDEAHAAEHSCAVEWFAGGVTPALAIVVFAPVAMLALGSITPVTRVARLAPAWQLPPGRGPPPPFST